MVIANYNTVHYLINVTDLPVAGGVPSLDISYSYVTPIEGNFDAPTWVRYFHENWYHAFWIVALYIIVVFSLRAWMEKRERFVLKWPLFLWNLSLAVFSVWGAVRSYPELADVLDQVGFRASVCICGYR